MDEGAYAEVSNK